MKIIFTKHAIKKLLTQKEGGIKLLEKDILNTLKKPDRIDSEIDYPKMIAIKNYDQKHIIRAVFKENSGIITLITFYPARKGRYEKK